MRNGQRRYKGPLQYFHNYEHDVEGRTHCTGPDSNPYEIEHVHGMHKISHQYAVGHGRGGKRQWWHFPKRLEEGYDMSSGVRVAETPSKSAKLRR
ncbi:hypothetical protein LCGC14_1732320 [marine sediment metagenome]|uniref:Uncharacterized protein n=1 Tax=marine sediment metagenome TaxID=412755 RepID=A0A0F9JPM4_9ZZZZ